ncbi:hypothetical protein TIFTF001_051306 [Ficus carica]|uniref:Uncharacterized protein n=1 Tax=Ficus carica TaxID=3494 RepID=A0AA87YTU3_FICCA|nr:hypothetical protein TIFTF001_051306 [Ficus carica]
MFETWAAPYLTCQYRYLRNVLTLVVEDYWKVNKGSDLNWSLKPVVVPLCGSRIVCQDCLSSVTMDVNLQKAKVRIEDLRETAQAKIGTRRLEEQPAKGKAVETADSPVRHTVRLTTADREVTIPVFLFQFPGVNVGSADGGSGVNIQSKASWGSAIAKHCGHHSSSYVWLAYNLRAS